MFLLFLYIYCVCISVVGPKALDLEQLDPWLVPLSLVSIKVQVCFLRPFVTCLDTEMTCIALFVDEYLFCGMIPVMH